jgi:hypothetical protein
MEFGAAGADISGSGRRGGNIRTEAAKLEAIAAAVASVGQDLKTRASV